MTFTDTNEILAHFLKSCQGHAYFLPLGGKDIEGKITSHKNNLMKNHSE